MSEWRRLNVILNKLVITVPTFGIIWKLNDSNKNSVNSAAIKDQININITNYDRLIPYYEICNLITNKNWILERDPFEGPYAYNDKLWISFDDKIAASRKSKYVKEYPLSGIMIDVSFDDFRGLCGEKYPILSAINEVLYPKIAIQKPNILLIVIIIAAVLIVLILILAIVVTILMQKKNRRNAVKENQDFSEPKYAETDYDMDYVYSHINNEMYSDVIATPEQRYHNFEKPDLKFRDGTDGYMEMQKL
jgi:chitinase